MKACTELPPLNQPTEPSKNFQHNKSQITLHIQHKKAHSTTQNSATVRKRQKLKIEPINKSNAKKERDRDRKNY